MHPVKFVTVNGRRTRVLVAGDADHPPMLLLHGIGRGLEDWEPQVSRYRSAGYKVIAPDLPGSGLSDRLPVPATLLGLAQSLIETLHVVGEDRPIIVMGNSLGGAVALQLLTIDPTRVATLVLVGSAGFGSEVHPMLRLIATPGIGRLAIRCTTRTTVRIAERLLYADKALVTTERIDRALRFAHHAQNGVVFHETARSVATLRGVKSQWRKDLLANASLHQRPTLVIWGDKDRILPATHLEAARRYFPDAQFHVFNRVGHLPQVEAADQFAELTLKFIR